MIKTPTELRDERKKYLNEQKEKLLHEFERDICSQFKGGVNPVKVFVYMPKPDFDEIENDILLYMADRNWKLVNRGFKRVGPNEEAILVELYPVYKREGESEL